jgi:serine/threonine protein kinase
MSLVFKARDTKLNRFVAIKQMSPDLERDPEAVKAFEREAAILGGIKDPNIVLVYDTLVDEEGHHHLLMEYIEGEHLGKLIRRGPVEPGRAVEILEHVLKGLQTMHSNGIVHQDIKPSNILIDPNGQPKIADLGLATSAGDEGPTLDWGSVQYLAPEVFGGNAVQDARLDIYALGMVAYELLLGEARFRAQCAPIYEVESEISKKWINWHLDPLQQLPLLSDVDAAIPPHLAQIVLRMMSKDRQTRYTDVNSILKDLRDKRQEREEDGVADDPNKTRPLGEAKDQRRKAADSGGATSRIAAPKKKSRKLLYAGIFMTLFVGAVVLAMSNQQNTPVAGKITATPGAELTINEHRVGNVPANGVVQGGLKPGTHLLRLQLKDYESAERSLTIKPGQQWSLNVPLKLMTPPAPVPVPSPVVKAPELPTRLDTTSGAMLLVPAGEFQYGAERVKATLPAFYIDETEVTNAQYRKFCDSTSRKYPANPFWDSEYFMRKDNYPVVNVNYEDALAFTQWAGKRLPSELEWEKAARGGDGREFPWGTTFDAKKANVKGKDDGFEYTAPVASFPGGASPYGVMDMAGNVW